MNTQKAAMEQLIDTLETYVGFIEDAHILEGQFHWLGGANNAIAAGRAALAETAEPVAWMCSNEELCRKGYSRFSAVKSGDWNIPVYTAPQPPAPAVELTDEDWFKVWGDYDGDPENISYADFMCVARAAIAAHEAKKLQT